MWTTFTNSPEKMLQDFRIVHILFTDQYHNMSCFHI
jgi:hypothetical protein